MAGNGSAERQLPGSGIDQLKRSTILSAYPPALHASDSEVYIRAVKKSRITRRLSQTDLAQRMKSSQSRIAKIEAGDPSVLLDLIGRALIASGTKLRDIQVAFAATE
jgi:DNA-binding XRE family transcriptional regulator